MAGAGTGEGAELDPQVGRNFRLNRLDAKACTGRREPAAGASQLPLGSVDFSDAVCR
jgi:hypothetical protein